MDYFIDFYILQTTIDRSLVPRDDSARGIAYGIQFQSLKGFSKCLAVIDNTTPTCHSELSEESEVDIMMNAGSHKVF